MGIIRKTFMFWLITGIIAAIVITLVIPKLKTKVMEKIPGRADAMKMVEQAKTAIQKHLPDSLKAKPEVKQTSLEEIEKESTDEPAPKVIVQDSVKGRDEKLFKRQCAILDDLI